MHTLARSRTRRWPAVTRPSRRSGCAARPRSSPPPTGWSPTPTRRPPAGQAVRRGPGQGLDREPRRRPVGVPARLAAAARRRLGLPPDGVVLMFAGRVQPLKAPDVVLHAAAQLVAGRPGAGQAADRGLRRRPERHRPGRPGRPDRAGPASSGIAGLVRLEPPCPQPELADWYRAATVVMVPSYSESFGLVAVEAQACGTPVVAAAVGGLRTAVRHGVSGILVDAHDPAGYARALAELIAPAPAGPAVPRRRRACLPVRLVAHRGPAAERYTGAMSSAPAPSQLHAPRCRRDRRDKAVVSELDQRLHGCSRPAARGGARS